MNKRLKYSGTDKMSDLICENYNLLLEMSRFGLSLGFGDQTVQQVCERQGVHGCCEFYGWGMLCVRRVS